MKTTWDIFCKVIDNYGDIGISWRLARQLVAEHGQAVRLWVDDMQAFARLCPAADAKAERQCQAGVEVRRWPGTGQGVPPAQIVVEAFACQLPDDWQVALNGGAGRLWLNLEYLSAEDWVASCHGLPSPQAGITPKYFFFPGFGEKTGGLLRERDLLQQRLAFQQNPKVQQDFLASLGVLRQKDARRISLFTYENPALTDWLQTLSEDRCPTQLLVPEGRILKNIEDWLHLPSLQSGQHIECGSLSLHILPFVSQDDYDRLLWCCDFNLVRGEDSFLRAQWAGAPMLWHIYRQAENAHLHKLEAFLALYLKGLPPEAAAALAGFWRSWSSEEPLSRHWQQLLRHFPQLQGHARQWAGQQEARSDLAAELVQFCRARLS